MMQRICSNRGVTISYERHGEGLAPLVLIHGAFSDHRSNWEFALPHWVEQFTVTAIARRGRGDTDATVGHTMEDEIADAVEVLQSCADEPVVLVGHSYGAHVALGAASVAPERVRRLVLYEPPVPERICSREMTQTMERYAQAGEWDPFSFWFFCDVLQVPAAELLAMQETELWAPILADAPASLQDLRSLSRYRFDSRRFAGLKIPVMLQVGSESPRDLYVTDRLLDVLPDVCVETFSGEAHEAMTTAPERYAQSVVRFAALANAAV